MGKRENIPALLNFQVKEETVAMTFTNWSVLDLMYAYEALVAKIREQANGDKALESRMMRDLLTCLANVFSEEGE